jgi:hypothetical protein
MTPTGTDRGASPSLPGRVRVRTFVLARRPADYPAAHSMDTTWYAVDGAGHVAVFLSGEQGPVPLGADPDKHLGWFLRLLDNDGQEPEDEDDDIDEWDAAEQDAAGRGFFIFEYIDSFRPLYHPYTRTWEPGEPLHVDQLPPAARKLFTENALKGVSFASGEQVQPAGRIDCFYYSDDVVGYLLPGETEVAAVPGREDKYRAALADLRKEFPKLRFHEPRP